MLSGSGPGPHKIQGIGAGFIPGILGTSPRRDHQGWIRRRHRDGQAARAQEGLWWVSPPEPPRWPPSSSRRPGAGKLLAGVPLPGERYLSSALYSTIREEAEAMTFDK